jgi:hypothetical protein
MVFHLRPARGSRRAPLNSSAAAAAAAAKFRRRRLPLEVGTQKKKKPAFPGQSPTTPQVSPKAPVHDNRSASLLPNAL